MINSEIPGLLTVAQCAAQLGVAKSTVAAWIATGKLTAHRVGTIRLVREGDLAAVERGKRGRPRKRPE